MLQDIKKEITAKSLKENSQGGLSWEELEAVMMENAKIQFRAIIGQIENFKKQSSSSETVVYIESPLIESVAKELYDRGFSVARLTENEKIVFLSNSLFTKSHAIKIIW